MEGFQYHSLKNRLKFFDTLLSELLNQRLFQNKTNVKSILRIPSLGLPFNQEIKIRLQSCNVAPDFILHFSSLSRRIEKNSISQCSQKENKTVRVDAHSIWHRNVEIQFIPIRRFYRCFLLLLKERHFDHYLCTKIGIWV